ncbi:MAG: hypothetical protein HOI61_08825 [Gammaproteobacteria bacterium]|nr:hypothetical protein [Gammaproteobacteria bacterium]MBT4330803.1 hypothetical protein [Gammaproteobacteria bacterium]MBT5372992.1 hypothetical protein [Gammaproteobacteria bacterium]MBT5688611.1 hypothetical protein [Gammaproteobacteria bacterium]MBT6477903.1 hypothetical protein [Gammaproteobacteria bacterium]
MLLRFALYELNNSDLSLPDWFLPDQHSRESLFQSSTTIREGILGKAPTNRRSLMQISHMLGHLSSATTLNSLFN